MSDPQTALFLSYAARGRNAWWRYVLTGVLGLALATLIVVVLAVALGFAWGFERLGAWALSITPAAPVSFFGLIGLQFAAMLAAFAGVARWLQKKTLKDICGRLSLREIGLGAATWGGLLAATLLINAAISPESFLLTASKATLLLAAVAVPTILLQTFVEEWLFRGWLGQGLMLATRNIYAASLIGGVVFGAIHYANGVIPMVGATAFRIISSFIAIRRGGIGFTYGAHLIHNLLGSVVVVSGDDVFGGAPAIYTIYDATTWLSVALETALLAAWAWISGAKPLRPR